MNPTLSLLCLLLVALASTGCNAGPAPRPDMVAPADLTPSGADLGAPADLDAPADLGAPADLKEFCCQRDAFATCKPIPCGGDQ